VFIVKEKVPQWVVHVLNAKKVITYPAEWQTFRYNSILTRFKHFQRNMTLIGLV